MVEAAAETVKVLLKIIVQVVVLLNVILLALVTALDVPAALVDVMDVEQDVLIHALAVADVQILVLVVLDVLDALDALGAADAALDVLADVVEQLLI